MFERRTQSGHSLIEMLVVVIIVAVLVAVTVPAVQRSRESARMAQCTQHQGDLAQAVQMHVAKDARGRFPGFRSQAMSDGDTQTMGWAAPLFDELGRNDLDPAKPSFVEVLVCPSDQGPRDIARLNYVANGGQPGTDSPADGIFFDHAKPVAERVYITNEDFRDGLANTILLAENLDATLWSETDEENQCILWPLLEGGEVNRGSGSRPSSHHPGGFVTAFADGRVKFMSARDVNDDPAVYSDGSLYVSLLTPGGDDTPEPEVYGADPCDPVEQTEVDLALGWIVRHQFDDGHWSFAHSSHPDCGGQCSKNGTRANNHIGATALALLPLLGAGSGPSSGPYQEAICKGLSYLMARQNQSTGDLRETQDATQGRMYAHLLANLALAEAHKLGVEATSGGCDDAESSGPCSIDMSELYAALESATAYTVDAQVLYVADSDPARRKGGWRYNYQQSEGDLSHTAWALMALKTAELSGVSVPTETYDRTRLFLETITWDSVQDQGQTIGTSFSYDLIGNALWGQPSVRMTVLGQLCHVLLGAPTDHEAFSQFTSTLAPDGNGTHHHSAYYNMHATHLMYLLGGSNWNAWNSAIQDIILPGQATSGHEQGSWDHTNPNLPGDVGIDTGGRLYATSMYALCLETHFAGLKLRRQN